MGMRTWTGVNLVVLLAGCASVSPAQDPDYLKAEAMMAQQRQDAVVTCVGKTQCDKAWALTRVYVSERSATKVQLSTDTLIETYGPVDRVTVSLRAVRTPGPGDTQTIEIGANCRGMYAPGGGPGSFYIPCIKQVVPHVVQFRPFVQARL
ncbi:hypothetical protein C0Q88_07625 [Ralstonia pickettii]|uniref:Lipoprotein n=2 Tax=Ralstonia pickettii TaxID=329 RepID=A0A2N4TXW0_RALPI|nr:hypothetical protein C0Q88_07625 [Ralstonia pickettii]